MIVARRAVRALLVADLRKLGRDPVLASALGIPIVLALGLRFGWAPLRAALESVVSLDDHRLVAVAVAMALSAMLGGWIVGFLLVEERSQTMIPALAVTPLTLRGWVAWRLVSPALISLVGTLMIVVSGGAEGTGARGVLIAVLAAVLAAACAPLFALALVTLADSEVEGLALAKLGALVFVLPVVTLYLDGPIARWTWLAGVLPTFWPVQLLAGGCSPGVAVAGGVIVTSLWTIACLRRLASRID